MRHGKRPNGKWNEQECSLSPRAGCILCYNIEGSDKARNNLEMDGDAMALQLPLEFVNRMNSLLGEEEFQVFMSSYDEPRFAGIRVNTLKISVDEFRRLSPFELRSIPWCETGFYIDEGMKPGKHPYYHAGLYYIQEPSAMAPVEVLDIEPGDRVLDLCAAPGGKSTQIAAKLQGEGILVTNDISSDRTKALAKNIELYGVRNAVILNETPEAIARSFPHYFNKILIDAPCSGEGMFRKDEDMIRQWNHHSVQKCTLMQQDILRVAAQLLAPGGKIVYSTCTFSAEENEDRIFEFLFENPDYKIVPLDNGHGFQPGRPDWLTHPQAAAHPELGAQTAGCGRLWPHRIEGEGHFLAVLSHEKQSPGDQEMMQLQAEVEEPLRGSSFKDKKEFLKEAPRKGKGRDKPRHQRHSGSPEEEEQELLKGWLEFASSHLQVMPQGHQVLFGGHVYVSPLSKDRLKGLKVVRPGWYVGTVHHGRFQPGHPLAMALRSGEVKRSVDLSLEQGEAVRYLKGETLEIGESRVIRASGLAPKGYVLITVCGYPLGWGKWQDGMIKNEYPAGWRWT